MPDMMSAVATRPSGESTPEAGSVQISVEQYLEFVTSRRNLSLTTDNQGKFHVLVDNETGQCYSLSCEALLTATRAG